MASVRPLRPAPLAWLCVAVLCGLAPLTAAAQNPSEPPDPETKVPARGPAGVGNADGSSSQGVAQPQNALWLRADEGVTDNNGVTTWADQSGNGNDATPPFGRPDFLSSFAGFGGAPAIEFVPGNTDLFEVAENSDLDNTDEITVFSVFSADRIDDGSGNSRGILGKRFDFDGPNPRYAYSQFLWNNDELLLDIPDNGNRIAAGGFSETTAYNFQGWYDAASQSRIYVNGSQKATTGAAGAIGDEPSKLRIGILKNGQEISDQTNDNRFFDGKMGEVIVYRTALNQAQRTVVNSYLANKYSLPTTNPEVKEFAYGGSYSADFAGIGRGADGTTHQFTNSSVLGIGVGSNFDADGFGADGRFIFFGHDGGGPADFTSASFSQPVNGRTDDAARTERTWRADLSFPGPKAVSVSVNPDSLPAKPTASDHYFLVVGQGSSFDAAPEAYELTDDSDAGDLTATVELEDGDYIALAAGQRVVNFTATSGSAFENTSASPNASVTATLNLPYTASANANVDGQGTDVSVAFDNTGDIGPPAGIQDSGSGNENGAYEASASDYGVDSTPVSIPAGANTATIAISLNNDGDGEQTEQFEITLDSEDDGITNAGEGADNVFTFSINDDDLVRDLTFASNDDNTSTQEDDTSVPETFTVALDQDGTGETAATSSPFTRVEFVVVESETDAIPGTDLSDETVDFKIVDESGGAGTEYQERLSKTRGRVSFGSGSSSAELKLEINKDALNDAANEDIVIDLVQPASAVLSQNPGNTRLRFTIEDDDSPPQVQFAQSSSEGGESTNGSVEVTLSSETSREVIVDYGVNSSASSATEGGSGDFTTSPVGDTVRFAPGETSRVITVNVNEDSESELDETVVLDLADDSDDETTRPTTGALLGSPESHTYTIGDNDEPAIGTTGPGGVGTADGSGKLALWLRADTLRLDDGDRVSTWPDASGRANDAGASGSARPTFRTNGRNGRPTLEFDGEETRMTGSVSRGFQGTYFAVGNHTTTSEAAFGEVHKAGGGNENRNILFVEPGSHLTYYDGSARQNGGDLSSGEYTIHSVTHRAETARAYDNGNRFLNDTSAPSSISVDSYVVGDDRNTPNYLDGNLAEFVVFGRALNDTRRILVENYLSAKYDIGLQTSGGTTKDVYAGDGNGDYDRGVFGVGRESSNDFHTAGEADGLRVKVSTGLDDGDYLMAGHRTAENAVNDTDVGGVSGTLKARSDRTWYVSRTDPGSDLTVNVTVDLTEAGLAGPAGDAGSYVLIARTANTTTDWTAVQKGADNVSGDEITFNDVSLSDGDEVTLGTTDRVGSPLGGAQIILRGTEGNENRVTDTSLDPDSDAGFAFIGPPETGGTYADLASDTDPQLIEFGLPRPMIYTYDSVEDRFVEVTGAQRGTAMESGRALLLYVFDDEGSPDADPVDPTLPITVSGGNGPPTSDQTVRFSPDAQQWLFVANPYAVPFELSAIETSGGDGVKSTAQIYEQGTGAKGGTYNALSTGPTADVVGVGQGFFLECNTQDDCPETVTLERSGRAGGDRDVLGYAKTAAEALPEQFASLSLQLTVESGGDTVSVDNAAEVLFYEKASRGWGRYDATKLAPLTRSYATVAPLSPAGDSTRRTAQVGLPWPRTPGPVEVPLDLTRTGVSGTATLRLAQARQADGWTVELVDTKGTPDAADDVVRTLRPEGEGYQFTLGEAKGTTRSARSSTKQPADSLRARAGWRPEGLTLAERTAAEGRKTRGPTATVRSKAQTGPRSRLTLRVRPSASALPVELSRFDVKARGQSAVLRWRTASEANNAGFYVQHQSLAPEDSTIEAGDWSRLGFVEGGGTTRQPKAYQFETGKMGVGDHVFRLVQVDTDGTTTRSARERLSLRLQSDYRVEDPYPNPTRGTATLPVTVRNTQDVSVRIYDVLGREVKTVRTEVLEAQQRKTIRLPTRRLASGTYFVRVRGDTFTATRRLNVVR